MIEVQTELPKLQKFSETNGVLPGEQLDLRLANTQRPIQLFAAGDSMKAADIYREVIGKRSLGFQIIRVDNPIQEASKSEDPKVIPLVIHSATDPTLLEKMFADSPAFGQLLMGHLYSPGAGHESSRVHVVGIANQGLEIVRNSPIEVGGQLEKEIAARRREVLGPDRLSNEEFRAILRSRSVRKIIAHALGPAGTNIAQAMELYIKSVGIEEKTELIVHPAGIEPMKYAEEAAGQVEEGVIPIHMECAVYYKMEELFDSRPNEVVLADHQYMPLDAMQLASIKPLEELAERGVMRIATHPSPQPLISPWEEVGRAEWIKATSNAAAALMVQSGEADACITTASGLAKAPKLTSRHIFGSPMMFFTIATPLNQKQLRNYL